MPLRIYTVKQKYLKNNGDISVYKKKIKKWIKSNKPYKRQKRGFEKKSIHSTRFGFLELYNRKEQQGLICPSGYSISQCFNVMKKLWYAYHKSRRDDKSLEKMKKYARAIQNVQEDMGIKTTSFPHLGLYGDVLILNDKQGKRVVREDHTALKKKQEEYEKWQAENSRKIQEHLQKPDIEKGESIITFPDDYGPSLMDDDYDWYDDDHQPVPNLLKPNIEKGESILTITDDIPFFGYNSARKPEPSKYW
jgi:hypothetical protein